MKLPAYFLLVLIGTACNQASEEDILKAEIDSVRREYEGARQELMLKRDSAKLRDMSKDAAFLARLTAAEGRATRLKQEVGRKKGEFRAHKKEGHPTTPAPGTE